MEGVPPIEENGRRLPHWMLGRSAASEMRMSDDANENKKQLDEGFLSQACQSRNQIRHSLQGKEALGADSRSLTQCESKRTSRRRKSSQLDKDCESEVCEAVLAKKYNGRGKKAKETGAGQKKRPKSSESSLEIIIQASNNDADDVDLTVEDLVVIAKEARENNLRVEVEGFQLALPLRLDRYTTEEILGKYDIAFISMLCVEMNKEKEHKQILNGEPELSGQLPTTVSSRNQSEGSLNPPSDGNRSSRAHKTTVSYDSTVILTSEKTAMGASGTGDPAQGMLDLFLGPLLKKPLEEEKSESMSKKMEFSSDLKRQKQNDAVGEEVISLGNKKGSLKDGSLKDKVAMFLG